MTDQDARPVRQFYVGLPAEVADALRLAGVREDRPGKAQAARYIVAGLRRDGYLADDPAATLPGEPETWIGARPAK
jgi:hypothetical protein